MAKYIQEGSEGFFAAQYGTIFKLSFVFCMLIMLVYYLREPLVLKIANKPVFTISSATMCIFSGISFALGSLCSAFSGYAGMWVSVRANLR